MLWGDKILPRGWIGLRRHWPASKREREKELKWWLKCPRHCLGGSQWSRSGCKATGTLAQVPSSVNASQRRTTPTMDRRHYTATLGTRERKGGEVSIRIPP